MNFQNNSGRFLTKTVASIQHRQRRLPTPTNCNSNENTAQEKPNRPTTIDNARVHVERRVNSSQIRNGTSYSILLYGRSSHVLSNEQTV